MREELRESRILGDVRWFCSARLAESTIDRSDACGIQKHRLSMFAIPVPTRLGRRPACTNMSCQTGLRGRSDREKWPAFHQSSGGLQLVAPPPTSIPHPARKALFWSCSAESVAALLNGRRRQCPIAPARIPSGG